MPQDDSLKRLYDALLERARQAKDKLTSSIPAPVDAGPVGNLAMSSPLLRVGQWLDQGGQMIQNALPPKARQKIEDTLRRLLQ